MADGPDRDLLDILTPGAAVLLPGAANALTARVIEDAGFSAVYVTGRESPTRISECPTSG